MWKIGWWKRHHRSGMTIRWLWIHGWRVWEDGEVVVSGGKVEYGTKYRVKKVGTWSFIDEVKYGETE
jgi:hypothetical protein